MEIPVIMYASYEIYGYFGYACWKFLKETKLILYKIPWCLYQNVTDNELGFATKLHENITRELQKRQVNTSFSSIYILGPHDVT